MKNTDKIQEYNKIFDYIIDEIGAGRLIEGSKLPSERELCERLGANRSSTREAISLLRGMGLVDSKLGSGNYIVNHTDRTIKYMIDIMLKMGSISTKEILDYRRFISRAIGTELIENGISEENEEKINNILKAMVGVTDEEFCKLDREFHLALMNATENRLFMKVMEPIGELYLDIIVDVIMASTDEDRRNRISMHENIFRSIQNRDEEACLKYMKVHFDYVESKLTL